MKSKAEVRTGGSSTSRSPKVGRKKRYATSNVSDTLIKVEPRPKVSVKELTTSDKRKSQENGSTVGSKKTAKTKRTEEKQVQKKQSLTKKERRQLKLKSKRLSELVIKLLPLWEVLRRGDTPKEKRFDVIANMLTMTKKKLADLCMAHDTARIIESAIQHGTEAQRWEIFSQLRPNLRLMAKSGYARHIVEKLIKYGAKEHRLEVFKVFRGHVARLVKHRFGSPLVDLLYNDYASASQRAALMQELYGNVHVLKLAENQVHSLSEALSLNPGRRRVMLNNLTDLLTTLATKGLVKYSIVQHLLLEYLQVQSTALPPVLSTCENNPDIAPATPITSPAGTTETILKNKVLDDEFPSTADTQTSFMSLLETLVDGQILPMLHTRDGTRAALHVLWASPVRLRKTLVKGLKTCISSIARDEHGHLFLIGLLDAVDDIVLLDKFVIKEILADLELFCIHPEARKVLLYALSPRDSRHLSPQLQQSLFQPGDGNPYTRKPLGVRAMELRSPSIHLLPQLLRLVSTRLTELFAGDLTSDGGRLALEDRGRIVLLCEILLRSAAHHLNPDTVLRDYRRSVEALKPNSVSSNTALNLSSVELEQMTTLRHDALEQLVQQLLVPKFSPFGDTATATESQSKHNRDELRVMRHRKARLRVERALANQNKPAFAPFESGEPMDTLDHDPDESQEKEENDVDDEFPELETDPNEPIMSFIERPEGQLLLRKLLQDGRAHKDFTLARMIVEHVSASNLIAWTRCNRSCFVLVNMYEVGDPEVCHSLRSILAPCLDELSVSPLPGAKVLLKLLQSGSES
ncbi:Pumilio domain containing protein [Fasciola hepatica]|uniref:Pumilio domain containing protein n=1 Tax=Fasciola hepatica TaxID=6192 RepID=A0A4E0RGB9_FASHE|nr:Pumilio domain containing protein [Fasciola hepatica]